VHQPIEARSAFGHRNPSRAFRILRDHVNELLEANYTEVAAMAAVEFINMMVAIDRLPDAARVLGYLKKSGDFGAPSLPEHSSPMPPARSPPARDQAQTWGDNLDKDSMLSRRSRACATYSTNS